MGEIEKLSGAGQNTAVGATEGWGGLKGETSRPEEPAELQLLQNEVRREPGSRFVRSREADCCASGQPSIEQGFGKGSR